MSNISDTVLLTYYRLLLNKPTVGYDEAPPGSRGIQKIFNWVGWLGVGVSIVAVIAAGIAIAIGRSQGGSNEHMNKLGYALGGAVVVGAAAALVTAVTA